MKRNGSVLDPDEVSEWVCNGVSERDSLSELERKHLRNKKDSF